MPITIYPDRTLTLEDLDFGGFTTDDFGDFSSPYNDGDYMSFASPGSLSNDYGTF
jgi:hypothetical protein